ncbi:MAG TPA: hypothetical protein PKZ84_10110 [Anaerolineae bacterium]|nr:hypothetical protein [Anaerolineae bacterium]HQI85012.1 hypothetical protein [Anaerolineae bacterium]
MTRYRLSDAFPLTDSDLCSALFGYDPRNSYNPGAERLTTLAGTTIDVGYPRVTWRFAALTIEQWEDLLDLVGDYSGLVYIETRNDIDEWQQWQAIARLPEPRALNRWGGYYRDVEIEFILLADLTPS